MIKNYMEEYTYDLLVSLLQSRPEYANICKCTKCCDDMLCLALNSIKPLYYTTKVGEVYNTYTQMAVQHKNDVISALVQAIEQVKNYEKH